MHFILQFTIVFTDIFCVFFGGYCLVGYGIQKYLQQVFGSSHVPECQLGCGNRILSAIHRGPRIFCDPTGPFEGKSAICHFGWRVFRFDRIWDI